MHPVLIDLTPILHAVGSALGSKWLSEASFQIHTYGLMIALEELAAGTQSMSGINCEFHCAQPVIVADLNSATHLYRIAQEAVNNALKHSGAKRIRITLSERDNQCKMSVEDDGRGLSPSSRRTTGLGLRMMEYRARLIGARLDTQSSPRRGMRISCTLRREP